MGTSNPLFETTAPAKEWRADLMRQLDVAAHLALRDSTQMVEIVPTVQEIGPARFCLWA